MIENQLKKYREYLGRAMKLAFDQFGVTSPNPPVGAVVIRDDEILSEGATQKCGCDHAEVCAINASNGNADGAELIVTLEPCCHYGKTPPCTLKIIGSGIRKVYVPLVDPNSLVSGKGINELRENGVEVIFDGEMSERAEKMIMPFLTRIRKKRPHVVHKSAFTLDGHTATCDGDSKWISSSQSRLIAHRYRSKVDAIVIGSGTLLADDPRLDVRIDEQKAASVLEGGLSVRKIRGENPFFDFLLGNDFFDNGNRPLRVLIGFPEIISPEMNFFRDDNFMVFASEDSINKARAMDDKIKSFLDSLVSAEKIVSLRGKGPDALSYVLDVLYGKGIMYVMLEGGSRTAGTFFDARLIDEIMYITAPVVTGGGKGVIAGNGVERMRDALKIKDISAATVGKDFVLHGYMENGD